MALIDVNIGPQLVDYVAMDDNKGFKCPNIALTPSQEKAFTLELREAFGRARELLKQEDTTQ